MDDEIIRYEDDDEDFENDFVRETDKKPFLGDEEDMNFEEENTERPEKKGQAGFILLILILIALGIAAFFYFDWGNGDVDVIDGNYISVNDQVIRNSSVVIDNVGFENPGFVVIHRSSTNVSQPGEAIGRSQLLDGIEDDVVIMLDRNINQGEILFAMHHTDDGDGVYEFPASDGPTLDEDGQPIVETFRAQ